jgi:exopolysaccharide biosynthesis protein
MIKYFCFLSISCLILTSTSVEVFALSYTKLQNGWFSSIHVIIADPKEYNIFPVRASSNGTISRETVASLAQKHHACAAVNGGFWKLNGDPAGILKIDHRWYRGANKLRGAIGWSQDNKIVLIDRIQTKSEETYDLVTLDNYIAEEWKILEHIVGGAPLLIKNGKVIEDYSPEQVLKSFVTRRHPRTAVGVRATGEWVFVVVDGRFLGIFGGMTIPTLAQFMLGLGCVDAVNLDGGSSSTLVLEGHIINRPCGSLKEQNKWVEAVSDAIVIVPILQ